jgi:hypothetical protein
MPGVSAAVGESMQQDFAAPCLVLPDMLPTLVEEAAPLGDAPRALTELILASELPPGLDAGGVARPDARGRPSTTLLQSVVYQAAPGADLFADLAIADASVVQDAGVLRSAHAYASPLLGFLHRELHTPRSVRPVICLAETGQGFATAHLSMGAYCPIAARDVGARKANTGKPLSVVLLLSQAWLDAGVRIWGENAHSLRLAIGGALGMRWLEAAGETAALQRFLDSAEGLIAAAKKQGSWSPTQVVLAMQIPIFRGMQRHGITSKLGELLRSRWGEFVPQSEVVALLRDSGVAVPNVFE